MSDSSNASTIDSPKLDSEGFLFYVVLAVVIVVACYNAWILGFVERIEVLDSFMPVVYVLGTFAGEVGLLSIAAVLGRGPIWLRMALALGVALCWISTPFLGNLSSYELGAHILFQQLGTAYLCFPLFFITVQLPLWVCRILFRWRVTSVEKPPPVAGPELTIAGILSLTAAVAIALGLVNLVPMVHASATEYAGGEDIPYADRIAFWEFIGGYLLFALVLSLVTTIPLTACVLRPRLGWVGVLLTLLWLTVCIAGVEICLVTFARHYYWFVPWRIGISIGGLFVSTAAPLFLLRHWNYRLRWGRE